MRSLDEYKENDFNLIFWRERLSIDEDGSYIITILFNDFCLDTGSEDEEFSIVIDNYPFILDFIYSYISDHGISSISGGDLIYNKPHYIRYSRYRRFDYPFDPVYNLYRPTEFLAEKIVDLSSNVRLNVTNTGNILRVGTTAIPAAVITERIKAYPTIPSLFVETLRFPCGVRTPSGYIYPDLYYDVFIPISIYYDQPLNIIKTPSFSVQRLCFRKRKDDYYIIDQKFCYEYIPGNAVTEYPLYCFLVGIAYFQTNWQETGYKMIKHGFKIGDNTLSIYIGYPAIQDVIQLPSNYSYGAPRKYMEYAPYYFESPIYTERGIIYNNLQQAKAMPTSFPEPHYVMIDPDIVNTDNITWG